jgi:hypothetical protein
MDDFRTQLSELIGAMLEQDIEPVVLVVDLWGSEYVKRQLGAESADQFRESASNCITNICGGGAFVYGEQRIIAVLPAPSRIKTFAFIQKLQRSLPLVAQSYNCLLQPEFDVLEYEPSSGVAGIMAQLVKLPMVRTDVA